MTPPVCNVSSRALTALPVPITIISTTTLVSLPVPKVTILSTLPVQLVLIPVANAQEQPLNVSPAAMPTSSITLVSTNAL